MRRSRHPWLSFLRTAGKLVAVLVGVLLLAGVGADLYLRHRMAVSVAQLDGTARLPGLHRPVTVRRDAHGVPHIEAADMDDLLAAQGWATASDRLWQMDMARRLPAGQAAEVLGPALVKHDRAERLLGMRDVAQRIVGTLPPGQLEQLQAYARGVNAYIANGPLPAEFTLLLYKPAPWQPVDSILVALSMAEMLDERWQVKIKREQLVARLRAHGDAALIPDLYPVGSRRDHPPVPSVAAISELQTLSNPAQVRVLSERNLRALAALGSVCNGCTPGSNEWAVSGAHTASGKPLLSNDMHLGHAIPDVWYESELRAGSFHVAGVTVPGLPFIAAGHNDAIAWGFTALGGDTQDIYAEQVDAHGRYRVLAPDGSAHWEPFTHEPEQIRVRGGADVPLDVERTIHGPVITPLLPGEHRTLALHWSLYDAAVRGLALYALDSATDWRSFEAAMASWWAPTLNAAYADKAGHIGYQAIGLVPVRAGGLQPLPITPGATQATRPVPRQTVIGGWTGYIPFEAMPSVLDPEGGIVATANSRVTPDNYPYQITLDWADPYRNERIWKWLGGKQGLRPPDMLRLQTDVYSEVDQEIARRLAYAVDHASNTTARTREAANLLRTWDGVLAVDSPAAAIVTTVEENFWPVVLGSKVGDGWRLYDWSESAYAREQLIRNQPLGWLPSGYHDWNGFLATLVQGAIKNAPPNLRDWHYGAIHTIAIKHPLWRLLPFLRSGLGPLPQSGDHTTVKQVSGNSGPSQRFTADLADPDASTENIVMGESGDPLSPFYRNQWADWYGGSTFPLPFNSAGVRAAARHNLRLLP